MKHGLLNLNNYNSYLIYLQRAIGQTCCSLLFYLLFNAFIYILIVAIFKYVEGSYISNITDVAYKTRGYKIQLIIRLKII